LLILRPTLWVAGFGYRALSHAGGRGNPFNKGRNECSFLKTQMVKYCLPGLFACCPRRALCEQQRLWNQATAFENPSLPSLLAKVHFPAWLIEWKHLLTECSGKPRPYINWYHLLCTLFRTPFKEGGQTLQN